jgi:uncharacterized protein YkwD
MSRVTRNRKLRQLLAGAAFGVLLLLTGCTPQQMELLGLINETRAETGADRLLPSPHAMAKAQAWAEHLAASETLQHSKLDDGMPPGFLIIGENVGRGGSVVAVLDGFKGSPAHHANTIDRRFQWGGVGRAVSPSGGVYIVEVFARY